MTAYTGYVFPLPEVFQQDLSDSFDDGLTRWDGFAGADPFEDFTLGTLTHTGSTVLHTTARAGFVMPSYADDLFGHILIVPSRLDLGNILSNQSRELEVANLFFEAKDWTALTNLAGDGIAFDNLPAFPHSILPFGSYVLEVTVSTDGPPSIDGSLLFEFGYDPQIPVPVTGTRIVMFQFIPQGNVVEVVEWKTDVIEAYDGTEQRIRVRLAPRQRIRYEVATESVNDAGLRAMLFDWLPRVFGLPIWFEKRDLQATAPQGATTITVDTRWGDFRVGFLIMIYESEDKWEAVEVEALTLTTIDLASGLANTFAPGAFVMPVRSAYAQTQTNANRYQRGVGGLEKTTVNFTTLDNEDLEDIGTATLYDGRVVLDDGNVVSNTLPESFERPVVVIDNSSGVILQTSRTDRSRINSVKTWDLPDLEELWRVRQLLHSFHGSQASFWVPSCRADLELSDTIGPGATTFRVLLFGYTAFIQSRRPQADVQIILKTGTIIRRRVIGSEVDVDEEVLTVNTSINPTQILVEEVERIEILALFRIADDEATIEHRQVGDATAAVNLRSIKE